MTSWLVLGSICLVNCAAVGMAAWRGGDQRLRRLITVNLILVTCFGGLLGQFGPLISNYGNAWYAAVIGAQLVILDRYGRLAASETMPACYIAVTLVLLCTYPLSYVPVLPGDSVGQPVVLLAQLRPQILLASYAALGPTLAVIDIVYAWLRPRSRLLAAAAAAVIGQIVDSLIFFPLAFWDASVDVILIAAASGVVLKIPMTLAIAASGLLAMSLSKRLCSKPASTTTG